MRTIYEFSVKKMNGEIQSMEDYKGRPLIIVNTASKCGFTSQFKELQELYDEYKEQGLVVLGFPSDNFKDQEFDDIEKTLEFCEVNFGVTFPMYAKVDVKGDHTEPLFTYLISQQKGMLTKAIKWNFTKFLVDRKGNVVERFAPQTSPLNMKNAISRVIQ